MKRGDQIIIQCNVSIQLKLRSHICNVCTPGVRGTKGYFAQRCAPLDLQTLPLFKTKIVHFTALFKTRDLILRP